VTTKKKPAPQVAIAKKAAAMKAAAAKQPFWLQQATLTAPAQIETSFPEQLGAANRSQGPPRLMSKAEILDHTGVSFPTIWAWMRAGTFPRSRVVGGKSKWLSTEIEAWVAALPVRKLKGDAAADAVSAKATS
jgi:predicted DNA-binding transcriptional regulator AlpA